MTNSTAAALTYGDTFTLPSITHAATGEPITFEIYDVRDIENAGDMYEDRAGFLPIDPATGHRLSTLTEIKIGRTVRTIGDFHRPGAEWRASFLSVSLHSINFTDKMNATVRAEVAALAFDLPAFTVAELRAALIAAAADHGRSVGHLFRGTSSGAPWNSYQQHEPARILRAEAMDADTRRQMYAALVAAVSAQAAESLKVSA